MGNCVASHGSERVSAESMDREEFVMVTRSDGKIMEYTPPVLVRDLMAAYPQHSVVHSEDATCCPLSQDKKLMVPGQLYRLLVNPNLPSLSKEAVLSEAKSIENGRISRERRASTGPPSSVKSEEDGSGIMTVKMVISKRELEALLSDRSMKENSLLLQLQSKAQYVQEDYIGRRRYCSNDGWRPLLESIPEVN